MSSVREVVRGVKSSSQYSSLEHSIRNVMERKAHHVETDPNDQIVAGTYRTKNFEQSSEAQKLYSSLPKNTDPDTIEQLAILQDKLFHIHKHTMAKNASSDSDVESADELSKKIMALAGDIDLANEHNYIGRVVDDIKSHLQTSGINVVNAKDYDPEETLARFASPSKEQTKERQDSDIDNSQFVISRNLKAQRKIKLIDAD